MKLSLFVAVAVFAIVSVAPAIGQTCAPGCGECEGSVECDGLSAGDPCSVGGDPGTCVLICPSEGDCCGCDTETPPDVPSTSTIGRTVLFAVILIAMSIFVLWHRRQNLSRISPYE